MGTIVRDLLRQALRLDEQDRALLAGALIESLHIEEELEAGEDPESVVRRRLEDLDRGTVDPVPWSQVRERLFRGYE